MLIAFAALAIPQRAVARPAEELGDSFHADQYPSQCTAITDLAKQVADELKSRPTTPKQIDLSGGGGVDEALRQQFIAALERELPESECSASADSASEPATALGGTVVARVKLRADDTATINAPWSSAKDRKLRSGSFTAFLVAASTRATLASRFVEKPWADDWSGFINANSSQRWLTAISESPGTTEAEATDSAKRAAVDDLAKLIRDQMNARAARDAGPHITVSREWVHDQVLSSLRRNVNDMIVRDVFVQRYSRPYGDVWQSSILIDASPKVIDKLVDSYNMAARVRTAETKRSAFAVGGIVAVIVLLYFFLNTITKGYFMWRLRAVALLGAIAAVLIVFARIGYS
jgi:hypothetical protein